MTTFILPRPRGFDLRAASDFYASFTPGSGMAAAATDRLTLAFRLDGSFEAVAATLRQEADALVVTLAGSDDARTASRQLSRMLGLDVDGDAWLAIGARDPVVAALQAEQPGFFTAAKASPYDAATWAIIAARTSMQSAARVKMAMACALGDHVAIDGRVHHVFPGPDVLARLDGFAGLPGVKVARLRGIGRAALTGRLDAERLRAMREDDALADLSALDGVGPWTASHILFRGAAPPDALPTAEPRVLHGFAHAYGLSAPSEATFRRVAESWRPFRMWVCVLLARHLARSGAWHAPDLARERVAAGGALRRRTGTRAPAKPSRPDLPASRPARAS